MTDMHHRLENSSSGDSSSAVNLWPIFSRRRWIMAAVSVAVIAAAIVYISGRPRSYQASVWMVIHDAAGSGPQGGFQVEANLWRYLESDIQLHTYLALRPEIAQQVKERLGLTEPTEHLLTNMNIEKIRDAASQLMTMTYQYADPEAAAQIANTWAQAYQEDACKRSTEAAVTAIKYLEPQMESTVSELREVHQQIAVLKRTYIAEGIDIASSSGGEGVANALRAIAANEVEQAAVSAQILQITEDLEQEPPELREIEERPSIEAQDVDRQLSKLNLQLQTMLEGYYEDSPEVVSLRAQIARLEAQLDRASSMEPTLVKTGRNPTHAHMRETLTTLRAQLDALRNQKTELSRQFARQQEIVQVVPEVAIEYEELSRTAESLEQMHAMLRSRLYEQHIRCATSISPLQVVKSANIPTSPMPPDDVVLLATGIALAVLLAAFVAVVVDRIDDTFADFQELEKAVAGQLVGVVPRYSNGNSEYRLVTDSGHSPFANALRMMAATVRLKMARNQLRALVVTSATAAEGKSIVAANIGRVLALSGERVLLIDADLHRSTQHRIFEISNDVGLSNVLVGEKTLQEAMVETDIEDLQVVPAGPRPPSPLDLLSSDLGQQVFVQARDLAEYVIWDTPPASFLADATVMAANADCCVFVVSPQAKRSLVLGTLERLSETGLQFIGVAANRVRMAANQHYYSYDYVDRD